MTSRSYLVTYHGENKPVLGDGVRYICGQQEIGNETKKLHWQLYAEFDSPLRAKGASKKIGCEGAHMIAHNYGCVEDIINYCSKKETKVEGTWFELGIKSKNGGRKDIEKAFEEIKKGEKTANDICEENPVMFHMYGRTFDRLETIQLQKNKRTEMTVGKWIWGATGVGKSEYINELIKDKSYYVWNTNSNFQCNYKGQEVVVIDDFRGEISYSYLLKMVDKWNFCMVDRKGKECIPFTSKMVVVTSSKKPKDCYALLQDESIDQLERRFEIVELSLAAL